MTTTIAAGDEIVSAVDSMLERMLGDAEVRRAVHADGQYRRLWDPLSEAGLFTLCLSPEHGGFGLDMRTFASVCEALGRRLVSGPILEQLALVATLLPIASDAARPVLTAAGEGTAVLAFCDPDAVGFNADAKTPRLVSGKVTGVVELVRFADVADHLVVAVDFDGGSQLVLVDRHADGVKVTARESFDSVTTYARVEFDDVGSFEVLGKESGTCIGRVRDFLRAGFAFELSGLSRHMLDASVAYVQEREQFGRPIGSFQAVQHLLADLCVDQLALEAHCDDVARSGFESLTDDEALVLKALASSVARTVGEGALQSHGGVGFTREYELHRWVLHALALEGHYGSARELSTAIGARLLDGELQPWR